MATYPHFNLSATITAMGKRGPRKEPPGLKLVKGTDRPADRVRAKAEPATDSVLPPDWLDEDGLRHWNELAPHAIRQGALTNMDVDAFGQFCKLRSQLDAMERIVTIEGYAVEGQKGNTVRHPLLAQISAHHKLVKSYYSDFGYTPGARADLPVADTEDDGLEAFVK